MIESKVQTRRDGVTGKPRRPHSRHRAEPVKPISARSGFTRGIGYTGRRAAVVATACAVLLGVGAAGQAAETTGSHSAADNSGASAIAADPLTPLVFERVRADAPSPPAAAAPSVAPAAASAEARSAEEEPAVAPSPVAEAAPAAAPAPAPAAAQAPAPAPAPAPEAATPVAVDDPAGAQAYAAAQLGSHGWSADQMECLAKLWTKESDWKTTATNPSSGAYGVVQSLPAEKMASAGADYRTNYRTQINWGLTYIEQRYGSPCGALNFHYAHNWY
jgi:hypothetical protein